MKRTRHVSVHWLLAGMLAVLALDGCGNSGSGEPPSERLPSVGLRSVTDLVGLAELRPPGQQVLQVSSYDRTGRNLDLGISSTDALFFHLDNSFLYQDGERYVIFDDIGPGIVYRIWMTDLGVETGTGLRGDIAFEFDDEPMARLHLDRNDLFSGSTPPFIAPLAGNDTVSSGGFYSIVPLSYAHHLRISTSTVPNYVQVTYTRLPRDSVIASFDPAEDTSRAAEVLAATGTDPKRLAATTVRDIELTADAGATQVVWEHSGPGTVLAIELLAPAGSEIPVDLRLQANWDGAAEPQVDAPLDDFFGAALGPAARSLAFGRVDDRYYCYFMMPFRTSARITVRNEGTTPFSGWHARVSAADHFIGTNPGYFYARANAAHLVPDGHDYPLLDTSGSGHVVGVVLTTGCGERGACLFAPTDEFDGAHLEGDERISVDGSRYPQLHGTGTEDFFNGGFYFAHGPFTLPTHGNPAFAAVSSRRPGFGLRSMYRLLLGDAIPFANHILLAIEHGPTNDVPADLSSLVFYYAIPDATLFASDQMTLGAPDSEAQHGLVADGRVDATLTSAFRGDDSDVRVTASGMEATRTRFRIAVDAANRGVRLRRLADIGDGRQSAVVRVNGAAVGTWFSADINPSRRWADLDFDIPAAFTAGRDRLDIELDARASPNPWTAYGYAAFSYLGAPSPPSADHDREARPGDA
jgi:hypothetical protein